MTTTTTQVYTIVNRIIQDSRLVGHEEIAERLDAAMCRESSGLETLGAIKIALLADRSEAEKFATASEIDEIIHFVNRAYGTEP